MPVESLVAKFSHQRFEPAGMSHNPDIPFAKSLVDYIFRWMGMQFIPGYRAANAPQRSRAVQTETGEEEVTPARHKATTVARSQNGGQNGGSALDSAPNGHGTDITDKPRRGRGENGAARSESGGGDVKPATAKGHSQPTGSGANGGAASEPATEADTLTAALQEMQQDAPACDVCGTITVRNGTCYKCLNCGNSMGCS